MRKIALLSTIILFLTACGVQLNEPSSVEFITQSTTEVAWGQRVAFDYDVVSLSLKDASGNTLDVIDYSGNPQSFIDLPNVPEHSYTAINSSLSASQYNAGASIAQIEAYSYRGSVEIQTTKTAHSFKPYGSVESGELNIIAGIKAKHGNCTKFFSYLNSSAGAFTFFNDTAIQSETNNWICFRTADIGAQDTNNAMLALNGILAAYGNYRYTSEVTDSRYAVDRNTISTLDGRSSGANGFDPSCEQLEDLIDPTVANSEFELINNLPGLVNAKASYDGTGVDIRVFGGDMHDDEFAPCDNNFAGHEYQVARIIESIAPDAKLSNAVVCAQDATCPSADIIMELIFLYDEANQSKGLYVANMSLGGPLEDSVMRAAIDTLGKLSNPVNVVVSAGNDPFASAHYPASFAQGVAPSGLKNLISVAAVGQNGNTGAIEIAGFNTLKNASLMAFGVNICTGKADFRCDAGASYPQNLGLNGTSFSAPVVTALAANYIDARNNIPFSLYNCLTASAATDKDTSVAYAFFNKPAKLACQP